MLPPNLRQEALSRAYVEAVTAHAGATVSWPRSDFGIDFTLTRVRRAGARYVESATKFDIQLKGVAWDGDIDADFGYDLTSRGYALLRERVELPRLLILVVFPESRARWVSHRADGLLLRRRAFWVSLAGQPAVRNRRSIRVTIPAAQRFTARQLTDLFARQARGDFR